MKRGGLVIFVATLSSGGAFASPSSTLNAVVPESIPYQELTQEAADQFQLNLVEIRSTLKVGPSETLYFKVNDDLEITDISSLNGHIHTVGYGHIVEQTDNIFVRSN